MEMLGKLSELRRCANMGFRGVEIGSHVGEKSLDHKDFWPLYKECENLGVVLFVHPWDMHNWDGRLAKYWMPWLVRPDLCATDCSTSPRELQRQIWTDSLVHDPVALHLLVNTVGKDKIVLGTDYPFPLGELEVGKVVEDYDSFSETDKNQLLWKNAIDMFSLSEDSLYSRTF
ncbi:hypothetical protein Y032_0160g3338 [Ancylostoma ceylanicum]|uniref:2-amino-3-carboxymuconate-6-semialdehyde decarboxylase n=2 Tax=Ancylostoma ceylanicum TaxID=53326 RepID=A0A016SYA9_9BILA|nr:hypothetical protein Y032_0160g3338 [Ancylostoma ceylanicum]